jgi:flagellin
MDGIDDTYKTGLENFLISPDTTLEKGEYKIELTAQVGGNVGSTGLNLTSSKLEDGDYWVDSATQKVYLANAAGTGPTGSALGTTADLNLGTATADGKFTQVTTYTLTVFPKSGGAPLAQASNVKFGEAAIDFKDGTSATSTLTVDKAQFAENDILTINGKKIGFYDSASSTYTDANDAKANIGGGVDEVIDLNAVADSNALASAIAGLNLSGVTLLASGSSVTVTAATPGTSGNSITTAFAGTNPTAVTGTGTLTGGTGTGQSIGLTVDFTNALAGYVKRGGALPTTPQIPYHSFNIGELDRTSVILKDSNDKIIAHQFVDNDRKFVELKGTGISFGTGVLSNGETATNIDIRQTLQDASVTFQIGTNAGEIVALGIGDIRTKALGIDKFKLTDETSASNAIAIIDSAIDKVSEVRSKLGAYQNRMEHTVNNITQSTENLTAAESRIRDADMAKEMTEFTKLNIINQSATAMLAQANQLPQGVLQLLKG